MTGKTVSSVHDEAQLLSQRSDALAKDQCALAGMEMYAQIFLGLAMYVYDHVSTPGYLSLLLIVPYPILLLYWARALGKRAQGPGGLLALGGNAGEKALSPLLFLSAMLDAVIVYCGLCAMIRDLMTDLNPFAAPVSVSLFAALSLIRQENHALERLSRFLRWIVGAMLLYCAAAAIPHGDASHFFPLLGYGAGRIARGAVWLLGAASGCCWPLLLANEESSLKPLLKRRSVLLTPALLSLAAGIMTMLVSVWLMPVYALAQPYTVGWRMMLVTHMTPSVAAWSLEFLGLSLLLLLALCGSLSRAAAMLARAGGRRKTPPSLAAWLAPLLLPAGLFAGDSLLFSLIDLSPLRAAAILLTLTAATMFAYKKKKTAPGKEASP